MIVLFSTYPFQIGTVLAFTFNHSLAFCVSFKPCYLNLYFCLKLCVFSEFPTKHQIPSLIIKFDSMFYQNGDAFLLQLFGRYFNTNSAQVALTSMLKLLFKVTVNSALNFIKRKCELKRTPMFLFHQTEANDYRRRLFG